MNLADRWRADPFMVMQNVYVIHGKPGIEGKLIIALLNQNPRFTDIEYKIKGDVTACKNDGDGCSMWAKDTNTGTVLKGTPITWKVAKDEGWYGKSGSKWKTMPEQMFKYRAATFFARLHCPEILLGMQTTDEIRDTVDMKRVGAAYEVDQDTLDGLMEIAERPMEDPAPEKKKPVKKAKKETPPDPLPEKIDMEEIKKRGQGEWAKFLTEFKTMKKAASFKKFVTDRQSEIELAPESVQNKIHDKWQEFSQGSMFPYSLIIFEIEKPEDKEPIEVF